MFSFCLSDKFSLLDCWLAKMTLAQKTAYSAQQTSVLKLSELKCKCGKFLILISFYESFRKEIDQHSTINLKCDGKCFHGSDKEKTRCHIYWQEISQKKFRPLFKGNFRSTDGFRVTMFPGKTILWKIIPFFFARMGFENHMIGTR